MRACTNNQKSPILSLNFIALAVVQHFQCVCIADSDNLQEFHWRFMNLLLWYLVSCQNYCNKLNAGALWCTQMKPIVLSSPRILNTDARTEWRNSINVEAFLEKRRKMEATFVVVLILLFLNHCQITFEDTQSLKTIFGSLLKSSISLGDYVWTWALKQRVNSLS